MDHRHAIAFALGLVTFGTPAIAQRSTVTDAGLLSRWVDGETRTTYDLASRSTVRTLTLIPPGPQGAPSGVTLVWHAYYPGRTVQGAPSGVEVRAYAGVLSDTRVTRQTDIVFALDEGTALSMHLRYAGSGGFVGFVPPGGEIPISISPQPLDEFAAFAWARRVGGRAIGFSFELRPDQVDALGRFARELVPVS